MSSLDRRIRRTRDPIERVVYLKNPLTGGPLLDKDGKQETDVVEMRPCQWWHARRASRWDTTDRSDPPKGTVRNVMWPAQYEAVLAPHREPPPRAERPEGMTRQAHRRLYRQACKARGLPWR